MGTTNSTIWCDQATATLPPHLHPAVHAVSAALSAVACPTRRWPSGRNYLFEVELLGRVSWMGPEEVPEDRVLYGVARLIALKWLTWEEREGEAVLVASAQPVPLRTAVTEPRPVRRRDSISKRRRLEVYLRDEWECWLCGLHVEAPAGKVISHRWEASVDHVIPHCDGGSDAVENLRTAHRWCNSARGPRDLPDRRAMRARVLLMQADEYAASVVSA